MRHFLIYVGGGTWHNHNVAYMTCGETPLQAVHAYLRYADNLTIEDDGTIRWQCGRINRRYPHALAYIEAIERPEREWLITEIPEWAWSHPVAEVMCGQRLADVEEYIRECRPQLRQAFPRSRAPAFVWYVNGGVLVTFYRRRGAYEITVLRRFIYESKDRQWLQWHGTYDDLMERLDLGVYVRLKVPEPSGVE